MNEPQIESTDEILATLIKTVHDADISGASMSARHPSHNGIMMIFYFHPEASEMDIHGLTMAEVERTLDTLDPFRHMPMPPKDPRNMN